MNQINTLQYPTINGLKSLQLDNLTTDVLNAKNMFLESLEVADIVVDSKLTIGDDAVIDTNGLEISNEELSYLDGATSNIQSQLGNLNTRVTQNEDDITELDTRVTQNEDDIILLEDKTVALTYDFVDVKTTINSKLDILGNALINGVLTLGNITHTPGANYIINNPNATGTLTIRHYDGSMIMRQLQIDQFINVSGINDLFTNRLYIGGSLIDFNSYNTTRTNTQKISYNAGTDTTTVSSALTVTGTTNLKGTNVTGEFKFINDTDTSKQMKVSWFAPGNGYWFESMNNGAYMYFVVKDMAGNARSFQFNHSQVYTNIQFFCDAKFVMSNQAFIQGTDAVSIQFIGSANPWDGWTYKSLLNNFYINWWSRNTSSVDVNTFRLHHSKISSLIDHEFLGNIIVNATPITPTEISYLDNCTSNIQTQLNNRLLLSGGTITGALNMTGTSAPANRIVQSTITSDVTGNANNLKYSIMGYNSNNAGGTASIILALVDYFNNNALWFFPNTSGGAYNSITDANSRAIVAGGTQNNNIFVLTTWSTTRNGIKIFTTSSTHAETQLWAGNSSIILNNSTGVTVTNTASVSFTNASKIYINTVGSTTTTLFEQITGAFTDTLYSFWNKSSGVSRSIFQLANNVILGAPLQFADATVQTTAMTTSYLTGVIQSVAGAMTSLLNPVGSVIAFAGSSSPSGWLLCQGQLISKTTYASLWAIIGDTYLNGRSADASNFYIPDLREFYIKGAGQNYTYTKKYTYSGGNALATFLDQEVLPHYHSYTDKGDGSVTRTSGPNDCANNNTRTANTDYAVYHPDGTVMASNENRPQTLVLNYIIKH
jgi:microcystin-dependent protein